MPNLDLFLQEVPFFNHLTVDEIRQIAPLFRQRVYRKGDIVCLEGEPGDEFFIVKSGVIKIHQIQDNKEVILAIFDAGDYFGEMALLERNQVRSATAQAMETSELYGLKRDDFLGVLENQPKLTLKLLQTVTERLRRANELIKDLTTLDARSRIIKALLRLAQDYGEPKDGGTLINLRLTHQQVADLTNTVRETVTKILLELQDDGCITVSQKRIWIRSVPRLELKIKQP